MKKAAFIFMLILSIFALISCSQATYTEKTVELISVKSAVAMQTVAIQADADADAYVLTDGTYKSVTKEGYQGEYGILKVTRDGSNWTVSYKGSVESTEGIKVIPDGTETISVYIGSASGATLSKKSGLITADCEASPEPVKDLMGITTDSETLVYGSPEDGNSYQKAVYDRLTKKVSTFDPKTTKAIVVFSDVFGTLSDAQLENIAECHKANGSIAIVNPDKETFVDEILPKLKDKFYEIEVTKYNTEGITRESWDKYRGAYLFNLSQGDKDLIKKGQLISVGFHNRNNYTMQIPAEEVSDITAYRAGLMADGLAQWINKTTKVENKSFLKTTSELQDLCEADIQTKEYSVICAEVQNGGYYEKEYSNVMQNIVTAYAMHSMGDNRDWYQIDQKITFRNGSVGYDPEPDLWWTYTDSNGVKRWFINPMYYFKNTLDLTIPGGSVVAYESHPDAANKEHSQSYSTGNGTATSVSDSGSVGVNIGFCGLSLTGGFSASYSHAVTQEESTSTTVGTSCSINDIEVKKESLSSSKIRWTYDFKRASTYVNSSNNICWSAPLLGYGSDCPETNSVIYYVDNPSGTATFTCDTVYWYDYAYTYTGSSTMYYDGKEYSVPDSFTMRLPVRYAEEWGISCVDYGDIAGNAILIDMFEDRINQDIIGGANNRINDIGGADEYDNTDANSLLNLFIDEFTMFEDSYRASGFTGTFKFQLQSKDTDRVLTKEYTITPSN